MVVIFSLGLVFFHRLFACFSVIVLFVVEIIRIGWIGLIGHGQTVRIVLWQGGSCGDPLYDRLCRRGGGAGKDKGLGVMVGQGRGEGQDKMRITLFLKTTGVLADRFFGLFGKKGRQGGRIVGAFGAGSPIGRQFRIADIKWSAGQIIGEMRQAVGDFGNFEVFFFPIFAIFLVEILLGFGR